MTSPSSLTVAMASRNLTLRERLRGAEFAARINGRTVDDQRREMTLARKHLAHTLVCRVRLTGGCHPCRVADTWRRT